MKKPKTENLKVKIKYSEDAHSWNNFINFLISFMIDNNFLGEDHKNEEQS
jgi:hypothetical protein